MKYICILTFVTLLFGCDNVAPEKDDLEKRLLQTIAEVDSANAFNGIIGVLRKNEAPVVVYHGYKSPVEKTDTLEHSDYFHLASNSKLFTGLAALKMMEQHGLSPTDSIGPYFPELKPALRKVTIQQLANHTCAIHDYLSLVDTPRNITNAQVMELLSPIDSTVYKPGSHWGYTNSGYVLLSLLIERVTGTSYNAFLRKEVLEPLGIQKAQLHPEKVEALQGYEDGEAAAIVSVTTGGSGIYFNTDHLISYFENQHRDSLYTAQAKKWASPWHDEEWEYGFGWFFSKDEIGPFRAHSGKSGGFESYMRVYASNELMIFILTNHVNGTAKPIREHLLHKLQTGELEAFNKTSSIP